MKNLYAILFMTFASCATEEVPVRPAEESELEINPYEVAKERTSKSQDDLPMPPELQIEPADKSVENDEEREVKGHVGRPTIEGSGPETRYVTSFQLNVRSKPNRFSPILRNLDRGSTVHVKMMGDWAELGPGEYIRTRHLSTKPVRAKR